MYSDSTAKILDLLNRPDDGTLVPHREGYAFFLPLQSVVELLGMPELPKQNYEQCKQPGWMTWKTLKNWVSKVPLPTLNRPTQRLKLAMMIGSDPNNYGLFQELVEKDVIWRPYSEWRPFIRQIFFHDSCIAHWDALLEAEWQLMCKSIPAVTSIPAKFEVFASSELMTALGAPGSRERMREILASGDDSEQLLKNPEFFRVRLADIFCVLFRFAAWCIVDASLAYWDRMVKEGKENDILFAQVLPSRQEDGEWSDSVQLCLEGFASLCGCADGESLSAALGRIMSEYDFEKAEFPDVTSRQRSLRDWLSGDKGRPKRESVRELANAVAFRAAQVSDQGEIWSQADIAGLVYRFHFAETSRHLLGEMKKAGMSDEMIESVFSTYEQEFRNARRLLGKPLA